VIYELLCHEDVWGGGGRAPRKSRQLLYKVLTVRISFITGKLVQLIRFKVANDKRIINTPRIEADSCLWLGGADITVLMDTEKKDL